MARHVKKAKRHKMGVLLPRRDTPFTYGKRWFHSLSDTTDFAERTNRPQAHIYEIRPDGSIVTTQVHFVGRPR
jgi:hypothetical protein